MQIFNRALEIQALRYATSRNRRFAASVLTRLSRESFHHQPSLEAYDRLQVLTKSQGRIPSWIELINDPVLPEETRRSLASVKDPEPVPDKEQAERVVSLLASYRKQRMFKQLLESGAEELKGSSVDIDAVLQAHGERLGEVRQDKQLLKLVNFGQNNNSKAEFLALFEDDTQSYVPTGIKAFDSQNLGIPMGSLFVIAANTSGGKSVMALELALNMSEYGYKVAFAGMEMSVKQNAQRMVANRCLIPMDHMMNNRLLKPEQKRKAAAWYKEFVTKNHKRQNVFSFVDLQQDVTIDDLLLSLEPFGYHVVVIDYISLLKGTDGDNQARALGSIARSCKVWATTHNCIIILLAQLDSEMERVRYARAIQEHASIQWQWNRDKRSKEDHVLRIEMPKSRNQKAFPFYLWERFEFMKISDLSPDMEKRLDSIRQERERDDNPRRGKKRGDAAERPVRHTILEEDEDLMDVSDAAA